MMTDGVFLRQRADNKHIIIANNIPSLSPLPTIMLDDLQERFLPEM